MTKSLYSVTARDVLRSQDEVEERIHAICFKTGPPTRLGAELEWTLHETAAPRAPLRADAVRAALGPHTPATLGPPSSAGLAPPSAAGLGPPTSASLGPPSAGGLGPPAPPLPLPLPAGGSLTVEPGGQLEISSAPAGSLPELHAAVGADLAYLTALLADAGLELGRHGIDPHREPRRLVRTPRYDAMERAFDARGPAGRVMMCSTAGLQVCLDAGRPGEVALRWAAAGALGPPLVAAFANSGRHAGRHTGLASARMAAWWAMDPRLTHPVGDGDIDGDPAQAWARYALAAPLTCVRRDGDCWDAPAGVTLGDWARGALPWRPTAADVDYHLSTLFPPVRPRGYLEVRYLDAQPGGDWIVPVAVLAALLADRPTTEAALDLALPVADRWPEAARLGLADPALRRTAAAVLDLACRRLDGTGLDAATRAHITETIARKGLS